MLQRRADYRVIGIPFPDALVAIVGTNTVGMSETETIFFTSAAARGSVRDPAADGCDEACPFFVRAVFTPALFAEYFEAIVDFDLSYVSALGGCFAREECLGRAKRGVRDDMPSLFAPLSTSPFYFFFPFWN